MVEQVLVEFGWAIPEQLHLLLLKHLICWVIIKK